MGGSHPVHTAPIQAAPSRPALASHPSLPDPSLATRDVRWSAERRTLHMQVAVSVETLGLVFCAAQAGSTRDPVDASHVQLLEPGRVLLQ